MTRKLSLELDRLQVESFETAPSQGTRGTVRGHETDLTACACLTDQLVTYRATFCEDSCLGTCPTCGSSCEGTCLGESCESCACLTPNC